MKRKVEREEEEERERMIRVQKARDQRKKLLDKLKLEGRIIELKEIQRLRRRRKRRRIGDRICSMTF